MRAREPFCERILRAHGPVLDGAHFCFSSLVSVMVALTIFVVARVSHDLTASVRFRFGTKFPKSPCVSVARCT